MYKVSEIRVQLKNKKQAVKVFSAIYPILKMLPDILIYNSNNVKINNIAAKSSTSGHNKRALQLVDYIKSIKRINITSLYIDTKKVSHFKTKII